MVIYLMNDFFGFDAEASNLCLHIALCFPLTEGKAIVESLFWFGHLY